MCEGELDPYTVWPYSGLDHVCKIKANFETCVFHFSGFVFSNYFVQPCNRFTEWNEYGSKEEEIMAFEHFFSVLNFLNDFRKVDVALSNEAYAVTPEA